MGRLLTVTKDGSLVEEYRYGPNGTRTHEMNALRGIYGRDYAYDAEDHLLTVGDTDYQYDADGFLTTKTRGSNITRYDYSSRGELLKVLLPDGRVIEYVHDPLGRRIAKKVDGVITEKYLWQGMTGLLAVYDGSNNLLMRFEYADGRMPVAMTKAGNTYYLTYDQIGSLKVVADASGNVVKMIDYDSFGNIISDTNPGFSVPFGFAGGLHDRDTGLVRFGFRDYDPDTGRWIAKDPILFAGGDVDLYGYAGNNPVSRIDLLGLKGGILIPIRNLIKKNINWWDVTFDPVLEQVLGMSTNPWLAIAWNFIFPTEAGIPDEESLLRYFLEKPDYQYQYDPSLLDDNLLLWKMQNSDPKITSGDPCISKR
jgi:RHS repeat-associated protein